MEAFINFFGTANGKISIVVVICVIVLVYIAIMSKFKKLSAKTLTYSAIAIALAIVLSNFKIIRMPQGGSVTCFSMMFIILIGYWFGTIPGILAGVTYGFLQLIIDPFIVHPMQLLLDYPLAFGALGLSGLFKDKENGLITGCIVGAFGRFIFSFLSGVVFFSEYTPEGFTPIMYSLAYNISYIAVEAFLTVLMLNIPVFKDAVSQVKTSAIKQY